MKQIARLSVLLLFALTLAGCAGQGVGNFVAAITQPIANPVSAVDIYRVKNVYAATLELAVKYREYCWSKSYAALMADPISKPVCQSRRQVVREIQLTQIKASSAIRSADNFVQNNPTVSAATVVTAAWNAVTNFQNAVPRIN